MSSKLMLFSVCVEAKNDCLVQVFTFEKHAPPLTG